MKAHEAKVLAVMRRRDIACPGCGYAMRGLPTTVCPECGRRLNWIDIDTPRNGLALRVAVFDLAGLVGTVVVNGALAIVLAVVVVGFLKGSWFTAEVINLGRGPRSVSGVLLFVLGASLVAWGAAWELSSHRSYRVQQALAAWCWGLTAFHLVGVVSVVIA